MSTTPKPGTLYDLLGLTMAATPRQVRAAHRALVRTLHPDVNSAPDAAERFGTVQRAYEILIDPAKRAEYDAHLTAGDAPEPGVVLSPTYAWVNVAGHAGAVRNIERQEAEEEVERIWEVFFAPRAKANN